MVDTPTARDRIYADIDLACAQRDASNPERVQDVVGNFDPWFGTFR